MSKAKYNNKLIEIFVIGVLLFFLGLASLILSFIYHLDVYIIVVSSLIMALGIVFTFLGINSFKLRKRGS